MEVVELFAFVIALFLGSHFCFLNIGQRKSNLLLGILLIQMSLGYINIDNVPVELPLAIESILDFGASPFVFSFIILHYFFSISRTDKKKQKKYNWFLIPFIITDLALKLCILFFEAEQGIALALLDFLDELFAIFEIFFAIGINVILLILIQSHNRTLENHFSTLEKKQLKWLRVIAIINISFLGLWIIDDGLNHLLGENSVSFLISEISIYATLINVLWLGYSSLRQPPIFLNEEGPVSFEEAQENMLRIASKEDELMFESIDLTLRKHKYFLNRTLTLKELADLMNVRDKELSRIINTCSNESFYGYINSLRVDHFKKVFFNGENEKLSILGMALESGFKSKSTFYSAFRKVEGMTPKEYQVAKSRNQSDCIQ